ncbi:putative transcriptional regulator, TetR family (tetracyclin resistance) [Amycolatopsis deserti]|uniref:Transcriptional regulator, TetR family (Tetracyclin resistance) n=1 Tax=Amycolatopsis deserti TaxID=185696 RepID=A0ABQ3J2E8_9PSEU|nr:TetR/AcrR family transcriptional regulator C-terminal domain-containing protein [Amycolatopsis deserti]GHF02085.1 putative transcriptional regulator, TetR family (tetracyclin resistance) [Amycolatopsis deserti]
MRVVATELGVRAPTLYWHVKNKQELLDAMATTILLEALDGLEAPGAGVTWAEWLADNARRLRRTMLRYRDGARVLAGTNTAHPAMFRSVELTLRTLQDAGFTVDDAAEAYPTLLHYTIGFTIEEQARTGTDYGADNPYEPGRLERMVDGEQLPLTARLVRRLFAPDTDAAFEAGLDIVLTGIRVKYAAGT